MPGPEIIPHVSHQPPSNRGHPLPRRVLPANSVTLRHHRLARDASLRARAGAGPVTTKTTSLAPRNSSGETHDIGNSDAKKWFDQSNQNPTATFDSNAMDGTYPYLHTLDQCMPLAAVVDPPFFQKESDSSNEDEPFQFKRQQLTPLHRNAAYTSTADDYCSVIDGLTVEIQKLKEELKSRKQDGPELLQKVKLFEIKNYGLSKETMRELEATLRGFVAGLDTSSDELASRQPLIESKHATRDHMYSGSRYKYAASPLGSSQTPFGSAYAFVSTNATSSSLRNPLLKSRTISSDWKTDNYLCEDPEGLYHRPTIMTDGYKKNLVVRRFEQLFTGKFTSRGTPRVLPVSPPTSNIFSTSTPVTLEGLGQHNSTVDQPPGLLKEPPREAQILPLNQQHGSEHRKSLWKSTGYASSWNGEQTEGNGSSGSSTSSPHPALPEQRPTRPRDLDPERAQVPSENMDYIKHLGLVPLELMGTATGPIQPGDYDAKDWVYLNLLCNLAQLHIINVTPDFVRSAVSDMSTKFKLSPDVCKIRWRGCSRGTRFASESSSGSNSLGYVEPGDTDVRTAPANESHQHRQSTRPSTEAESRPSAGSSKNLSKFGPHISSSSDSFHYKPLFVRQHSFTGTCSLEETHASLSPFEGRDVGELGWGLCGSGTSNRRKRRRDGVIIYYSGAPFCIDLSGDRAIASPSTYSSPSGQPRQKTVNVTQRGPIRLTPDSSLADRPSSAKVIFAKMDIDGDPGLTTDTSDDVSDLDVDVDMPWSTEQQYTEVRPLEPSGLGGVVPDDHFMVVVTTARSKSEILETSRSQFQRLNTDQTSGGIMNRLASTSTSLPASRTTVGSSLDKQRPIGITYTSGRIKRLAPVPLPPPAILFQSFSTGSSSSDEDNMSEDICDKTSSEELMNWCANHHRSVDYPGTRTKLVSVRDE
jgi:hypothetical protein